MNHTPTEIQRDQRIPDEDPQSSVTSLGVSQE